MDLKFRRNPDYQDLRDEVTPEPIFLDRRKLMAGAAAAASFALTGCDQADAAPPKAGESKPAAAPKPAAPKPAAAAPAPGAKLAYATTAYKVAEGPSSEEAITGYNNFYEFGTSKSDPAANAERMTVSPWSVEIAGEAEVTGKFALTDVIDYSKLEERVYRHRCVEAWSMVIPWVGVPMSSVLAKYKPKPTAKYVQFETYLNKKEMPWTASFPPVLDWPYREGLRMDEAMNELSFFAVGVYGKALPKQNGAPLRTVIPWKYGFKSTKSVVKISFVEREPSTAWNKANAHEYGFYSNVNPEVDHPRWSQASERVIGGKGLSAVAGRRRTEMFNGYEKQVAHLYAGMDLSKNY